MRSCITLKILVDYILRMSFRVLGGYYSAISFFSISVILIISSATKLLLKSFYVGYVENGAFRGCFQLSVFLFIPLTLVLINLKYRYKSLVASGNAGGFNTVYFLSFAFFTVIDLMLFGYLIVS